MDTYGESLFSKSTQTGLPTCAASFIVLSFPVRESIFKTAMRLSYWPAEMIQRPLGSIAKLRGHFTPAETLWTNFRRRFGVSANWVIVSGPRFET